MPRLYGGDLYNYAPPPGTNVGDVVRWGAEGWETATPAGGPGASTAYAPGSFTVATENYLVMSRHLKLTTTQRATLAGTATLRIS